jgi:hypothetical protein
MSWEEGWAIQITRKDGTSFLAGTGVGEAAAFWCKRNRKQAVRHKKELREHDLNAKVVPALYHKPEVIKA